MAAPFTQTVPPFSTISRLPLRPVDAQARIPGKYYIRAGMGFGNVIQHKYFEESSKLLSIPASKLTHLIKITDNLIVHYICPCDLNKPSAAGELAQLANHGCGRFRLCEVTALLSIPLPLPCAPFFSTSLLLILIEAC